MTHQIDIVGRARSLGLSTKVSGEIEINTGDARRDEQIAAMYRQTDEAVYTLLTGELPPGRGLRRGGTTLTTRDT